VDSNSKALVKKFRDAYVLDGSRVAEIGSVIVEGTGSYREFFTDCEFVGFDIEQGVNVDVVIDRWDWSVESESFDVVFAACVFEHDSRFWLTFSEMVRICKKGGVVCVVAPSTGNEHRFPVDCYRFLKDSMVELAVWQDLEVLESGMLEGDGWDHVYLFARKK